MDLATLFRELFIALVAAGVAIWGNNFVQNIARKETYREKVIDKTYEMYSDLSDILYDLNKSIIETTRADLNKLSDENEIQKCFNEISIIKDKLFEFHIKKLLIFSDKTVQNNVQEILKLISTIQIRDIDAEFSNKIWSLYSDLINIIRQHLGIEKLSGINEMKIIYK